MTSGDDVLPPPMLPASAKSVSARGQGGARVVCFAHVAIDTTVQVVWRRSMRTLLKSVILAMHLLLAETALGVAEGDFAPDFVLPVLGGESTRSLSASHGRVRYIDFWASWCPPCRVSVPEIVALQEELGGSRFEVIAINVDERIDDALNFLERYPVNYDVLSDPRGDTASAYALRGMPTSFVVDPQGRVTLVHVGFRPGDMKAIRAHIVELLDRL